MEEDPTSRGEGSGADEKIPRDDGDCGGAPHDSEDGMQSCLRDFWDRRYDEASAPEEWYCGAADLASMLCWAAGGRGRDATLLHVGCGTSQLPLASAQAISMDMSLPALNSRRRRAEEELLAADLNTLPFRSASFDIVLDKGTIDWVVLSLLIAEDRDERLARLRDELLRVLRPGGRLVVVTGLGGTSEDPYHFLACGGPGWAGVRSRIFDDMEQNYRCYSFART